MQSGRQRMGYRQGKLKGLRRVRQDGKLYIYHRASGTRMPDLPEDDPEFLHAYLNAENGAKTPRKGKPRDGTLAALALHLARSDRYRGHSDGYRAILRRNTESILATGADVPVAQLRDRHIRADLASLDPHPANERRKTWRALMAQAIELGWITEAADPTQMIKRRATPKAKQHTPWSPTDIAAFRAQWTPDTPARLAFELLHWTGARIGSAVTLGAGMVDADGWLHFVQSKTDGPVWVPFDRALPDFVDPLDLEHLKTAIAAQPRKHLVWIVTAYGRPRSTKSASQWFSKAARLAGITGGKTAHGLRVTRAIKLAEAGATTNQIGAWTGHESLKEIEHYSRQAERKRLLSGPKRGTKIVQESKS